jgi:hypothetical protein
MTPVNLASKARRDQNQRMPLPLAVLVALAVIGAVVLWVNQIRTLRRRRRNLRHWERNEPLEGVDDWS